MSKFYHVTNCNRTIKAGAFSLHFVPYEHTSCWLGVYEAVDPAEIAALDELATRTINPASRKSTRMNTMPPLKKRKQPLKATHNPWPRQRPTHQSQQRMPLL